MHIRHVYTTHSTYVLYTSVGPKKVPEGRSLSNILLIIGTAPSSTDWELLMREREKKREKKVEDLAVTTCRLDALVWYKYTREREEEMFSMHMQI